MLIHSRFRPEEKAAIVERLTRADRILQGVDITLDTAAGEDVAARKELKRNGLIVVSTQVVEAGVDISSAVLVTDAAPWPSLVQRFGRCNRRGEFQEARVYWVDPGEDLPDDRTRPYSADEIGDARRVLMTLVGKSVGPAALPDHPMAHEHRNVLRRKDLFELFDTTPDLAGYDLDVSRFIRDSDDHDVYVVWRANGKAAQSDDWPPPRKAELCPVPIREFREFVGRLAKKQIHAFAWDFLDGRWRVAREKEICPGRMYLLPVNAGGYADHLGWDAKSKTTVREIAAALPERDEESSEDEPFATSPWQSIAAHTDQVVQELDAILRDLQDVDLGDAGRVLRLAARWHDRGKAHQAFVAMLDPAALASAEAVSALSGACAAKAPDGNWRRSRQNRGPTEEDLRRRHFRHELASALAVLQAGPDAAPGRTRDLAAYLVAAHHGKVRCSIRSMPDEYRPDDQRRFARGVWDGDVLPEANLGGGVTAPEVALSLESMELGFAQDGAPSWVQRILKMQNDKDIGPFRLGYLEALLRAADRRASMGCLVEGKNHGR